MSKAQLVVDKFDGVKVTTDTFTFHNLDTAQRMSDYLSSEWSDEGWRKYHDCWTKERKQWRQKTIVCDGVEYTEEDGVDE